jgi:hypothetical protein
MHVSVKVPNTGLIRTLTGSRKREAVLELTSATTEEVASYWDEGSKREYAAVDLRGSRFSVDAGVNPMVDRSKTYRFAPGLFLLEGGVFLGKASIVHLETNDPSLLLEMLEKIGDPAIRSQFDAKVRKETGVPLIEYAALVSRLGVERAAELLRDNPEMFKAEAARITQQALSGLSGRSGKVLLAAALGFGLGVALSKKGT